MRACPRPLSARSWGRRSHVLTPHHYKAIRDATSTGKKASDMLEDRDGGKDAAHRGRGDPVLGILLSGSFIDAFALFEGEDAGDRDSMQPEDHHAEARPECSGARSPEAEERDMDAVCARRMAQRKGGVKTGKRRRSRKRRMEAALAGFKPSVPDEFHFEPINFDPLGLTTPLCKRCANPHSHVAPHACL